MGRRDQHGAAESWQQLALRCRWPDQRSYEVIRPVVLFGESAEERALETGEPVRTLYRQIQRFTTDGLAGLTAAAHPAPSRTLPPPVRQLIVELKSEYPPLNTHEIGRICFILREYRPATRTIQRVLTETPPTPPAQRRYPPYHSMGPIHRRRAVIQLHLEGWNKKSIAGYLQTTRQTVHTIVQRWSIEDLAALVPRSHTRKRRVLKVRLKAMLMIQRLQKNPRLGAFRVHAALKREGIKLSPRTCGRILAVNRGVLRQKPPLPPAVTPLPMPFAATRRYQYWSVDIRYLDMHRLGGGMVYCITILDNYSRAVIASVPSRSQNLAAYLSVLFHAIRNHGAPEALVSDGGAVFRAKQALEIYTALGIWKEQIAAGEPWQNYVETTFNIQRRMADAAFATANTWQELVNAHACWVADYNWQDHWGHRDREDGQHSPAQVLNWVRGRIFAEADLRRLVYTLRFRRRVDRLGLLRFRHWKVYGEAGLAGEAVVVWLYEQELLIVYEDDFLAQYTVQYQKDRRALKAITEPRLYQTHYQSPQLTFWEPADDTWRKAAPLRLYVVRRKPHSGVTAVQEGFPLESMES